MKIRLLFFYCITFAVMLYRKEYISETTLLAIWKIEETKDELLALLQSRSDLSNVLSIKSQSRILEVLAARLLLKELLGVEKPVSYYPSGKPYFADDSFHISISHSKKYVAIVLDKTKHVAVDIEQISDKIKRVKERVVSDNEYIDPDNEVVHLLLHWSAKEAMFKYIDQEGVNFIEHLHVSKFIPQSIGLFKSSESRTDNNCRFDAYYESNNEFVLVCLWKE